MKTCKQCSLCIANIICGKFVSPTDASCKVFTDNLEALKPSHNTASDAMRRFDDVDIENLSDYDMAWTARIIVREYRAALTRIA